MPKQMAGNCGSQSRSCLLLSAVMQGTGARQQVGCSQHSVQCSRHHLTQDFQTKEAPYGPQPSASSPASSLGPHLEWHCFGTLRLEFTLRGWEGREGEIMFWKGFGVSAPHVKQSERCVCRTTLRAQQRSPVKGGSEGGFRWTAWRRGGWVDTSLRSQNSLGQGLSECFCWFTNWPLSTEGKERLKKEGNHPRWAVAGLISKGTYCTSEASPGWLQDGQISTFAHQNLQSSWRGLAWVPSSVRSRWSQRHPPVSRSCLWGSSQPEEGKQKADFKDKGGLRSL